jgi:DNA-binding CsgD family transcriptional regulator
MAPRDASALDGFAETALRWILHLSGHAEEGRPSLERAVDVLLAPDEPSRPQLYSAGVALSLLERQDEGDALAKRSLLIAREQEGPRQVLAALDQVTPADVRAGMEEALAHGEGGLALAGELGLRDQFASLEIELARIDGPRGNADRCRGRVAEAVRIADAHGIVPMRLAALGVLGVLELGLGRFADAAEQLEQVVAGVERIGLYDRDNSPHPDLVETLIRIGRSDEAASVLDRYAERAERGTPLWGGALAARFRGVLAEDEETAEQHFGEALALHDRVEDRFQRARTLLAFGERLRRASRKREARERLREAYAEFEALEAKPWADRARRELRASGERLRRVQAGLGEELTPQELQVALQVSEGKSNKDVAAALFLSPSTVEFHLTRIYRKLGFSSRAEVIRRFAGAAGSVAEPVCRRNA